MLGRNQSGVGVVVGVDIFRQESESESESLEIRRLRSPAPRLTGYRSWTYRTAAVDPEFSLNASQVITTVPYKHMADTKSMSGQIVHGMKM